MPQFLQTTIVTINMRKAFPNSGGGRTKRQEREFRARQASRGDIGLPKAWLGNTLKAEAVHARDRERVLEGLAAKAKFGDPPGHPTDDYYGLTPLPVRLVTRDEVAAGKFRDAPLSSASAAYHNDTHEDPSHSIGDNPPKDRRHNHSKSSRRKASRR